MQDMTGYFIGNIENASTVAMYYKNRSGEVNSFAVTQRESSQALKTGVQVYVLANNGTASASEALIGALVCSGLVPFNHIYLSEYGEPYTSYYKSLGATDASIKSGKSYGKGIMQTTYTNLTTGEALKLTTAEIYWPDNKTSIHGTGLSAAMGCKTVATDWTVTKGDKELQAVVQDIVG
jgi:hypothetical protein